MLLCGISLLCYLRATCFRQAVNFVAGSILKAAWNILPPTFREKHETKRRDRQMEKDLVRVKKLKSMIRNRRNLEALQRQRKLKRGNRGEAPKQETTGEGSTGIEPSAPFPDDVVLGTIPEESVEINVAEGAASSSKTLA